MTHTLKFALVFLGCILASTPVAVADWTPNSYEIDPESLLPPVLEWKGRSRNLIVSEEDPWRTPVEESDFQTTPTYRQTFDWIARLVAASPRLEMVSIGRSWEGRELWMVIASAEGASTPEQLEAAGKPKLLAQAGIHSGEIDGKDAGMIFLRELAFGRYQELLDHASLLFVPILNVDGHERVSALGRVNQRGPQVTGWRTNARNLNLNRDYAKLDTPEIRAMVAAIRAWQPDLYMDLHVTDGLDKQPDVTWSFSGTHAYSPGISAWLESPFSSTLWQDLLDMGHIPGPHIFVIDRRDMGKGVLHWEGGPRYSDGYGSARHQPTVLVENHSLKPYQQRVLGMTVLLASTMGTLGEHGQELAQAVVEDSSSRPEKLTLGWGPTNRPDTKTHRFLGIEAHLSLSDISGEDQIEWTGKKIEIEVPKYLSTRALVEAVMPGAYWVPVAWSNIIALLGDHGVEMEVFDESRWVEVEMYRFAEPEYDPEPFEGRFRVKADSTVERRFEEFPPGSVRNPDQPTTRHPRRSSSRARQP